MTYFRLVVATVNDPMLAATSGLNLANLIKGTSSATVIQTSPPIITTAPTPSDIRRSSGTSCCSIAFPTASASIVTVIFGVTKSTSKSWRRKSPRLSPTQLCTELTGSSKSTTPASACDYSPGTNGWRNRARKRSRGHKHPAGSAVCNVSGSGLSGVNRHVASILNRQPAAA